MEPLAPSNKGTTFFKTCFNGINALAGFGILSIPYALSQGGWLSLTLLFVMAAICCYTGLLLQRCMDSNALLKTYPDIGDRAFGRKGRLIVATFMYLELYLAAIMYLILEGDNLEKLFPCTKFNIGTLKIGGKQGFVLLAALVILPTTWIRSLSMLAYVSFGGILACIIMVASVLWSGAVDGVGFHERGVLLKWSGVTTAMGLFAFSFTAHAVFPTMYAAMRDKTIFSRVLFLCFGLCFLIYGSMAVVGYLMYGQSLKSQVTLNLPKGKLSSKIAIYTTLINTFTKYALEVTPIANAVEDWLQVSKRFISIFIRTTLVAGTVVVALTIPFFEYVMAFTGSFLSITIAMLLPCACYLKIFKNSLRWRFELIVILSIMLTGSVIAIMGTYSSLKQIILNL